MNPARPYEDWESFGYPRLAHIEPGQMTRQGLYQQVLESLGSSIKEESPSPIFKCFVQKQDVMDDADEYSFEKSKMYPTTLAWSLAEKEMYFDDEKDMHSESGVVSEEKSKVTLEHCFEEHLKEEDVDEWYCSHCKSHQMGTKKLDLWKLPKILIIHLKRFIQHPRHMSWTKQNVDIEYPLEEAPFGQYCIDPSTKDHVYELFATSNHRGSINSGHCNIF